MRFVRHHQITTELINPLLKFNAFNGKLLALISEQTPPLPLLLAGNHRERISYHVIPSSHAPLVLGLPWLQKHNPVIDWVSGRVISWSSFCHSTCLKSAQPSCALKNCVTPPELTFLLCLLYTTISLKCLASIGPCLYLLTDPTTAPLTCCLELPSLPASSTIFRRRSGRPWRGTSLSRWIQVLFDPLPHHLERVFSFCPRRIRL